MPNVSVEEMKRTLEMSTKKIIEDNNLTLENLVTSENPPSYVTLVSPELSISDKVVFITKDNEYGHGVIEKGRGKFKMMIRFLGFAEIPVDRYFIKKISKYEPRN